jgi:hypothetical protein
VAPPVCESAASSSKPWTALSASESHTRSKAHTEGSPSGAHWTQRASVFPSALRACAPGASARMFFSSVARGTRATREQRTPPRTGVPSLRLSRLESQPAIGLPERRGHGVGPAPTSSSRSTPCDLQTPGSRTSCVNRPQHPRRHAIEVRCPSFHKEPRSVDSHTEHSARLPAGHPFAHA